MKNQRDKKTKQRDFACLFDLDGVILNTEHYYTEFWHKEGEKYFPEIKNFEMKIKGHSLNDIYSEYFNEDKELQNSLRKDIDVMEKNMKYEYISGVERFLKELKENNIPICLVTSSLNSKMRNVFAFHKELKDYFSFIVTGEDVVHSKPNPDCYLLGAKEIGFLPKDCIVFEDSLAGIFAAGNAKMKVIALSTTQTIQEIKSTNVVSMIIPNFDTITIQDVEDLFH